MAEKPPPQQIGDFLAPQYYGLLCNEPNHMHHFYAEHSTMILVINGDTTNTSVDLDQIHNLLMSLNFVAIEIKSTISRECWGGGVLLVVSGYVKIKDVKEFRNFIQTFYLAPQGDTGYFIMNDILNIINRHHATRLSNPVIPLPSEQIDRRFHSKHPPPVTDPALAASIVTKINLLMTLMVNANEFPKLQQQQQPRRQLTHVNLQTSPVKNGGSSSNSSRVAKVDDTIHENVAALKIEEPKVDKVDDTVLESVADLKIEEPKVAKVAKVDDTIPENVENVAAIKIEEPPQVVRVAEPPSQSSGVRSISTFPTSILTSTSTQRGRGNNTTRGHNSGRKNKGKGKSKR